MMRSVWLVAVKFARSSEEGMRTLAYRAKLVLPLRTSAGCGRDNYRWKFIGPYFWFLVFDIMIRGIPHNGRKSIRK